MRHPTATNLIFANKLIVPKNFIALETKCTTFKNGFAVGEFNILANTYVPSMLSTKPIKIVAHASTLLIVIGSASGHYCFNTLSPNDISIIGSDMYFTILATIHEACFTISNLEAIRIIDPLQVRALC